MDKAPSSRDAGLLAAIKKAGGTVELARRIALTHGAVSQWKRVPAQRVRAVASASGVAPHMLRPDLFDPPSPAPTTAQTAA